MSRKAIGIAGAIIGIILIVIPEPATTATGVVITIASLASLGIKPT